ncbi:MmgE/PrpD family protein [Mesorhizobium sp. CCNWLW179-1]|uniref:MmgE/PrpD family protein n=1 Tax=unclassified Mesorhizobium TaxID=325217 RepID=UPI003014D76E
MNRNFVKLSDHLVDLASGTAPLPEQHLRLARYSLFDWMTCGIAGKKEPVAALLRQTALDDGASPVASLIGGGLSSCRLAALVNGATSHALDYDDTHFAHIGHLSVGVYPAALAVGELVNATVADVIAAFLLGAEAAIRIGLALGTAHYDLGFHQTATAGAFGATVAAARLLDLGPDRMREAIGLAATRASGIKNQFGSMGKPLNAGLAASNGVECALWAQAGLTSARDGIEGVNGFLVTHSNRPAPEAGLRDDFLFDAVKYKLHACCHGTHAMIEALAAIPTRPRVEEINSIVLRTSPRWLNVCDIKTPRTGLEIKFSYAWLAGMVLMGISTADEGSYTAAMAADPTLADVASRMTVIGDPGLSEMQAEGELLMSNGAAIPFCHDLNAAVPSDTLARGLRAKSTGLLGALAAEELWNATMEGPKIRATDLGSLLQ